MTEDRGEARSASLKGWEIEQGKDDAPICLTLSFEDGLGAEGRLSFILPFRGGGPAGRTLMQVEGRTIL